MTPVRMAPVESARTVIPEPRPVIAIGRRYYNANHWRRRNVEDRARRRCVIVSRCESSVRLNYLGAGNQAQSRSKPESEHRQCHHHKSLSHDRISLLLFGRLNPTITGKLPKNRQSAAKYLPRRDAKNAESIRSFAQIGSSKRLWRNPCKICVTCGATARDCKCFDPVRMLSASAWATTSQDLLLHTDQHRFVSVVATCLRRVHIVRNSRSRQRAAPSLQRH